MASKLNSPVKVIAGVLIIKELFDYSDDKMVENLKSYAGFSVSVRPAGRTVHIAEQIIHGSQRTKT